MRRPRRRSGRSTRSPFPSGRQAEFKSPSEKSDGGRVSFEVTARLDTEVDVDYFRHGGILRGIEALAAEGEGS